MPEKLIINVDGAARGNPGPAAIGVVLQSEDGTRRTISRCLGRATNNQAEYQALIAALEEAVKMGARRVEVRSDSELIVMQLNGRYRVKNPGLKPLFERAQQLRARFESFAITSIPRERNRAADELANCALDGKKLK